MPEELKILSPYSQVINDLFENFDINSVSKKLRDAMYQSYTEEYMTSLDFIKSKDDFKDFLEQNKKNLIKENKENGVVVYPVKEVVRRITTAIPLIKEEQFITVVHNQIYSIKVVKIPEFWVQPTFTYIPDVYMNLRILDDKMNAYGYIRVRQQRKKDNEGRQWWFAIYNPDPSCSENMRDEIDGFFRLFHYAPEIFRDDILEKGLVPSYGGRTYLYPDKRVFFYAGDKKKPYRLTTEFQNMMLAISFKTRKKYPMWSGYYDVFELDMDKLPANVKIFWDPNADDCVYFNIPILPDYLILREDKSRTF